jgi:TP901 family phage tail tape measure protein
MAELLPPATQQFLVDSAGAVAGIDLEIAALERLAATIDAVAAQSKGMEASLAAASGGAAIGGAGVDAGAAAAAQTALGDAEKMAADAAKLEAEMAADLAVQQNLVKDASLASADAQRVLGDTMGKTAVAERLLAAEQTTAVSKASGAEAAAGRQSAALGKVGSAINKLGKDTLIGAAAFAVYGVDSAAKYQSQIVKLGTSAGETGSVIGGKLTGNLKTASDEILKMSVDTGTATTQLTAGMYMVESSGYGIAKGAYHGADGLNVLKVAAQGARAEQAPLADVTNALTTVMRDFNVQPAEAARVMNTMTVAVGRGKMTMADFAAAIGTVSPIAQKAGITFGELSGAMATLTQHGATAHGAVDDLTAVIRGMSIHNLQAVKEMDRLGLSSTVLEHDLGKNGLMGTFSMLTAAIASHTKGGYILVDTLNKSKTAANDANVAFKALPPDIQKLASEVKSGSITWADYAKAAKALGPVSSNLGLQWATMQKRASGFSDLLKSGSPITQSYATAMTKMLGSTNAYRAAMQLLNGNLPETTANIAATSAAWNKGGTAVKGFADVQQTLSFKIDQLKSAFHAVAITVGNVLIPPLMTAMNWMSKHEGVVKALAIAVGVVLVAAVAAYTISMISAAAATIAATWPILAIIAGVALLVVGVMYAWNHFKGFRDAMIATWHALAAGGIWLWHAMEAVWRGIVAGALWLWHAMEAVWHGISAGAMWLWHAMEAVWRGIMAAWHAVVAVAMWLWHAIEAVWHGIAAAATWCWNFVKPLFNLWLAVMKLLGAVIVTAYRQLIEPAFKGIGAIVSWAYHSVIKPTFDAIVTASKFVGAVAMWLWNNAIKPAFDWIVGGYRMLAGIIMWWWHTIVEPAAHAVGAVFSWLWKNAIKPAFDGIGSAISGTWDFIHTIFNDLVKAAQWVGDKISSIFGGIGHMINGVTGGVSSITHMLGFAEGGPVPGQDGAPIAAILHGGEYVLSREMIANITSPGGGTGVDAFTTTPVTRASGGGGGGNTVVVVHVHNQGSVLAQRDLERGIQEAVLRMNLRNSNNRYSLPVGR